MNQTYDFQDGYGAIPAHRHPNGGGWIADSAAIDNTTFVHETACVGPRCRLGQDCRIGDGTQLGFHCQIDQDGLIGPHCRIGQDCRIGPYAGILSTRECLRLAPVGSRDDSLTIYRVQSGGIHIRHGSGCLHASLDAFAAAVERTHGANVYGDEYRAVIALARVRFADVIKGEK